MALASNSCSADDELTEGGCPCSFSDLRDKRGLNGRGVRQIIHSLTSAVDGSPNPFSHPYGHYSVLPKNISIDASDAFND